MYAHEMCRRRVKLCRPCPVMLVEPFFLLMRKGVGWLFPVGEEFRVHASSTPGLPSRRDLKRTLDYSTTDFFYHFHLSSPARAAITHNHHTRPPLLTRQLPAVDCPLFPRHAHTFSHLLDTTSAKPPQLMAVSDLKSRYAATLELLLTTMLQQPPSQPRAYSQAYLPNGAGAPPQPSGPVPGARPLEPNQGRVQQVGHARVLCIADVRGEIDKSCGDALMKAR